MKYLSTLCQLILLFLMLTAIVLLMSGCSELEKQIAQTTTTTTLKPFEYPKLSWEKYPENKPWSKYVYDVIDKEVFEVLDMAKDTSRLCPKYSTLSRPQRIHILSELISAISYYESSWNPKSASVDVGSKDKRDTWSIGLMQVSVTDQQMSGLAFGFKYDDLLKPEPNLYLALKILEKQVKKTGLIILPNSSPSRYWAVLLDFNKYSKIEQITAMTKKVCTDAQ